MPEQYKAPTMEGPGQRIRLAEEIACRWMVSVSRVYGQAGKLVEKYDVITPDRPGGGGEYPLQDGFGWTNGVMSKLMALYPKDSAFSDVNQCARPSVQ